MGFFFDEIDTKHFFVGFHQSNGLNSEISVLICFDFDCNGIELRKRIDLNFPCESHATQEFPSIAIT